MPRKIEDSQLRSVVNAVSKNQHNFAKAAAALGIPPSTVKSRYEIAARRGLVKKDKSDEPSDEPGVNMTGSSDQQVLTMRTRTVRTLEQALKTCKVDLSIWEVERWTANKWDMVAKKDVSVVGDPLSPSGWTRQLAATELWQVKVWFKRKSPLAMSVQKLIANLKRNSPQVPLIKRKPVAKSLRRAYEMCLFDPHMGMHCFAPGADHAWSLDDCEEICMWAVDNLVELSKPYWPLEEIVLPWGNDLFHIDNMHHTTTGGTLQPEAVSFYETYPRGVSMSVDIIEQLKKIAPVKVKIIPGNHDRLLTFTLGHVLQARFHNDKNVQVDSSPSPYKFWRYGTNLVGFDHGHSIAQVRMAALMANETGKDWHETSYREWHCGDQHRKGSSKPTAFEEQGVSVEYLPGLTPPNEWHRLKSYNWQKRGALGYVWDHDRGPIARLQVNINSYTGRPTGEKRRD